MANKKSVDVCWLSLTVAEMAINLTTKFKTNDCCICGGTGKEIDHALVGRTMKQRRLKTKLSAAAVGRSLGVCRSYICNLEKGQRTWRHELIKRYLDALK